MMMSGGMPIKTYQTAQVAKLAGIHPNTVRLYEELGLIPRPMRRANDYRMFTDQHVDMIRFARLAFQVEVLQNGLRKQAVAIVKTAAIGDYDGALQLAQRYDAQLQAEQRNAKDAVRIVRQILSGHSESQELCLNRSETAQRIGSSIDTIRNWELNGLLTIKRKENGYRVYTGADIDRLKIIRSLRCANYSLDAILRMLSALSADPNADIEGALDAVHADEDIISVCDKLISSLQLSERNAVAMQRMLHQMKRKYIAQP